MSSTLYREALLEVDELKKMAEENAKNQIIEAVTPRIRQLIESQLLGEKKVEELDDLEGFMDDDVESEDSSESEIDLSTMASPDPLPSLLAEPEVEAPAPAPAAAPKIKIDVAGDLNIEMEEEIDLGGTEDDDLILGQQVSDVVENYILGKRSPAYRINELARRTNVLSKILESINLRKVSGTESKIATLYFAKLLDEAVSLASNGIIIEESVDLGLLSQLKTTIKEIRHMANRRDAVAFRRLLEELEADEGLQEMIREEDEDAVEVEDTEELELDAEPAADVDVADVQGKVQDLAVALGMTEPVPDEGAEAGDDLDDDDDDDDDAEDFGADEEPLELGEADEVYEIDEAMLRRELLRMKEGLEAERGDPSADESEVGDPMKAQGDWGGSDEVIEVSEEDLVEALHAELNSMRRRSPRRRRSTARRPVRESRRAASRRSRRTVSRRPARSAAANVKLRQQLQEMNVFNAKLLFANKLMQNRELTRKQQRTIVEALDSAKTVNEAKLLYKSLSKSLTQSGKLSESKNRLLASSSRSARSASPAANGVDGDRWALLAGLNDKK